MDPSLFMHDIPDSIPNATESNQERAPRSIISFQQKTSLLSGALTFATISAVGKAAQPYLGGSSVTRIGGMAIAATTLFSGFYKIGTQAFSVDTRWRKDEIIESRCHNAKDLLPEIWNKIAGFLNSKSLANFGSTCIAMHDTTRQQRLERTNRGTKFNWRLDNHYLQSDFIRSNQYKIKLLNLKDHTVLDNEDFIAIIKQFPNLTHINLQRPNFDPHHATPRIYDEGIIALATHCPKLTHINLKNRFITDKSITAIATHCPNLNSINIKHEGWYLDHSLVTDKSIIALATHCPNLAYVNLKGCRNISNTAKNTLRQKGIRVED